MTRWKVLRRQQQHRAFRADQLLLELGLPGGPMLARAIRDLVVFRPGDQESHFLDYVESHRRLKITVHDIEPFRLAFVAEVIATAMENGNTQARSHRDAWNAALKLGLGVMAKALTLET